MAHNSAVSRWPCCCSGDLGLQLRLHLQVVHVVDAHEVRTRSVAHIEQRGQEFIALHALRPDQTEGVTKEFYSGAAAGRRGVHLVC